MKLLSTLVSVVSCSLSPVGVNTRWSPVEFDRKMILTKDQNLENTRFGVYHVGDHLFTTADSVVFVLNRNVPEEMLKDAWDSDDEDIPPPPPSEFELSLLEFEVVERFPKSLSELVEPMRLVAKYSNDCRARRSEGVHSATAELIEEYELMMLLNDLQITPRAYDLSHPSKLGDCVPNKVTSNFAKVNSCEDANVRLLTMDLVGEVVEVLVSNLYPMSEERKYHVNRVLQAGIATIELLRKLHNAGYVHGDIHGGNIAAREPGSWDLSDLILIDLGKSGPIGSARTDYLSMNFVLASPWHWETPILNTRDDLFRAVQMVADLLGMGEYQGRLEKALMKAFKKLYKIEDEPKLYAAWAEIKKNTPFFDESRNILRGAGYDAISYTFNDLKEYLLDTAKPDYEHIIGAFRSLIRK